MKDKIILITGANRGIGHNILKKIATCGYTVIGTSRSKDGADMISDAIKDHNGKGVVMDVTNQDSINTSINKIKEDYGVIYGLVNNAGITNDNLLMRMSDEQWNSVIETNLTSLYRVTKSVVKDMMKARTGRIVNIGSIVGVMGNAGQSNYSATKSGLLGFTKSLARELSSRNINVNAVSPGFIDTDMTKALSDDQIESLTKNIPLGRIASPDEVSSVVAFLLSDDSSYITGENINVNGGLYM
jgi:3-oxoacyl-[acyl-carrier protein] reductase